MDALAAQVWHFWLALPIVIGTFAIGAAVIVGYLVKVVRPKYPRD